jgi:hypothetical protein
MSNSGKRRNFTNEDDVMLLRQVSLEMPFQARRGLVMERWASVAAALHGSNEFSRPDIDGKKACNRFTLLLDMHRRSDNDAARASGVEEDVDEKTVLLDDLLAAYDDSKLADARRAEDQRDAAEHVAAMGQQIRLEAMESMGKRKRGKDDDDGGSGGGKFMKMFTLLHEQSQAELQFQREKLEKELEEKRLERQVLTDQIRQQNETMTMLLKAVIEKL